MSLYIDNDVVTVEHLAEIDPEVYDIANAEGISVDAVIGANWNECADRLLESLQCIGDGSWGTGQMLANARDVLGWGTARVRVELHQIVTSSRYGGRTSTLQRWMIHGALVRFYRAAINRRLLDRYAAKYERAEEEAKRAWRRLMAAGLPVVIDPLPCPGAAHDKGVGRFDASAVSMVSGGGAPEGSYDTAITWVSDGVESGTSAVVRVIVPEDQRLQVSISGLVAPGSAQDRGVSQRAATGWNLYVGEAGGDLLWLQNSAPISLYNPTYMLPCAPVSDTIQMGDGQAADYTLTLQNVVGRG
jgi:hypothetical protein